MEESDRKCANCDYVGCVNGGDDYSPFCYVTFNPTELDYTCDKWQPKEADNA